MSDVMTGQTATGRAPSRAGVQRGASPTADLVFDAFFGGALAGSAIALFFLILDVLQGRPLFTPSLIGTALFTDADPSAVTAIRLVMVAYFSVVHFAAFFALGGAMSRLFTWSAIVHRHPAVVAGAVFLILTLTLAVADLLLMPGVIAAIGVGRVLAANLVCGCVMAWFIRRAHTDG
jgi:hypothetical protein